VRKLLLSAAVFGMIAAAGRLAPAQQPSAGGAPVGHGANASRYGIAVVDISYIFKSYPGFTEQIEKLKKDMEAADGTLKADRDRLVRMEEQRNTLKPGTDQFKQLDEQLAHQKAEFSIKQGTVRRDFLEREAQVYYQTYTQVSEAVKTYAQQNNIGMVLRFNGDQVDPQQREDVMRLIMQPIVHQNHIDITPDVIAVLTRGGAPAAATSPTASRPTGTVRQ
jgi:Skp family chaperone for outer membrane proteins